LARTQEDWSPMLNNLFAKGTWVSMVTSYQVGPQMAWPPRNPAVAMNAQHRRGPRSHGGVHTVRPDSKIWFASGCGKNLARFAPKSSFF
jgi:hypothetical protein